MGIYLNPDGSKFEEAVNSDIYIDKTAQEKYLDFLRDLLKDKAYIHLAYMTGILPIKKYGTHSALNMFDEFSMIDPGPLARYVGFTEEEVQALCEQYHMDVTEVKSWYDRYSFANDMSTFHTEDDVLTLLIHLGYVSYDYDNKMVKIPNDEVRQKYINSVSEWNQL